MSKKYFLCFILLSLSFSSFAGFYKCNVKGKVIYSGQPCGEDQQIIKVQPKTSDDSSRRFQGGPHGHNNTQSQDDDNYYSVENQLKRLEQEKEMNKVRRLEDDLKETRQELQKRENESIENTKVNTAQCEYYKARVKEEEHNLRQGYKSREARLSDESYLRLLRVNEAEFCS